MDRAEGRPEIMPSDWREWQRWTDNADWTDWRSWLRKVAATDWASMPWPSAPWDRPARRAVSRSGEIRTDGNRDHTDTTRVFPAHEQG